MKIDSTNIYYDLVRGFNNQYLLYLARKPFLKVDLSNYMVNQDTVVGTRSEIYNMGIKQPWFKMYKCVVVYYLKGKGVTIQNYDPPGPITITQNELMEIVSKFFYVYDYEDGVGLYSKLCGGINPYVQEGLVINPIVEAFAFQALVNIIGEDKTILNGFYHELIPKLNEEIDLSMMNKAKLVDSLKNYVYRRYEKDSILRRKIIMKYEESKSGLPFEITDLL